jgi:hypothetical protein
MILLCTAINQSSSSFCDGFHAPFQLLFLEIEKGKKKVNNMKRLMGKKNIFKIK